MKKTLILLTAFLLATFSVQAASTYTNNLKNAVKQDIQNAKKANDEANKSAAKARKDQKIKEIDSKLTELNKEKETIQKQKDITETQRTLQLNSVNRQIDFYTKQKKALQ